jgi:D-alanyl-D-alanine carboxypeptidase (penicillin-binding protein 5/6)
MLFRRPRPHEHDTGELSASIGRRQALVLLGVLLLGAAAPAQAHSFLFHDYGPSPRLTPPDRIQAVAALLIDAQTGEVLYARNPDKRLLPASTTKLMTALLCSEHFPGLQGAVRISEADRAEPSNVPVVPGEVISVDDLFHALLIESANDSARALGRASSPDGTVEGFVDLMNQRAREMGLSNTHFHNPNGLPAPAGTHFTSCADLMKIFQADLRNRQLRTIMSTLDWSIRTASGYHHFHNHNRLLAYYPGMGPAKTGWTVASRHTYAASCRRGNRELLLTLLDSPDKWKDAMILFNWGFAQAPATVELPTASGEETGDTAISAAPETRGYPPAPAGRADGR